eukprot:8434064-Lingulodinium_polyedra.AAC.1
MQSMQSAIYCYSGSQIARVAHSMRTPKTGVRMECATRAICEPLRRRTVIAIASLCSVCKRYTMLRLRSLSAA